MAGNKVPMNIEALLAMSEEAADGLHDWEKELGITGITEAKLRADIDALRKLHSAAGAAKTAKLAATTAHQVTDDAATAFLSSARGVIVHNMGSRWSGNWSATGFPNMSTRIPKTSDGRMNLCAALCSYFTTNPTFEVGALNISADAANKAQKALNASKNLLDQTTMKQGQIIKARNAAGLVLAQHMRSCITDLKSLLAPNDDRWHNFGLNAPADPQTPEAVESLTLTTGLPLQVIATWPRARRATRYRPFVQIEGVDEAPIARDPVHDLTVTLDHFASGQTISVYVVAANNSGSGLASPTEKLIIA